MIQKALDASRTEDSNKLFIIMNAANYKLAAVMVPHGRAAVLNLLNSDHFNILGKS